MGTHFLVVKMGMSASMTRLSCTLFRPLLLRQKATRAFGMQAMASPNGSTPAFQGIRWGGQ